MPAIPIIAAGIAAGGSIASTKMAASAQKKRQAELLAAQEKAQGPANELMRLQGDIYRTAQPGYEQALGYYGHLLGRGGRNAAMGAVAPAAENISDLYKGAERGVTSSMRGGTRDLAVGELAKRRSGDIARLYSGVQPAAADKLLATGQGAAGQAVGALGAAGNIYGGLIGPAFARSQAADQSSAAAWGQMGSLIAQLLQQWGSGGGGGGGGSSRGYVPLNVGAYGMGQSSGYPTNYGMGQQ